MLVYQDFSIKKYLFTHILNSASYVFRGRTMSKESSQSDFSNCSPNKMTPKSEYIFLIPT